MRVLVVVLSSSLGGTERHAIELANGLAEAGHQVCLALRKRPPHQKINPEYDALCALVAPAVQLVKLSRKRPMLGLMAVVWRFRPDILHTHAERSTRLAGRMPFRPPLMATNHCGWQKDYTKSDGLICLTKAEQEAVPHTYKGQVFRIGNWVLPHTAPSAQHVARLRQDLGLTPQEYVVGCVARLAPEKRVDGLIEAFLAADLPHARLVLVGPGDEEEKLRKLAARGGNKVVFAGFRQDVRDLYHVFDVCVLNSIWEGYPLTLMEALEAGTPVIATQTAGALEIARYAPIDLIALDTKAPLIEALRQHYYKGRKRLATPIAAFSRAAILEQIVQAYQCVIGGKVRGQKP